MIEEIIISSLALIISTIFNSEMDTILEYRKNPFTSKRKIGFLFIFYKLFDGWSWWWEYRDAQGLGKLNPFRDGWHFCKGTRVYLLLIPLSIMVCLELGINIYFSFLLNVPLYIIQGFFFELSYEN